MAIKSPFPGLDPYLQAHWGDVHHSLIQYTRDALQSELPDGLLSRVEERVFIEDSGNRVRSIAPDARILEWRPSDGHFHEEEEGGIAVAVAESRTFIPEVDETTEGYIEIREADGSKVVTVIEIHSPANKAGAVGMAKYLEKQAQVILSDTSLVEIDFIRGGQRVLAMFDAAIPFEWREDSLALISKSWQRPAFRLYHWPLRKPLSPLPIPLRPGEKPVYLNLQEILEETYRKGRYDRLNYAVRPEPPLADEDQAWADQLLIAAAKR